LLANKALAPTGAVGTGGDLIVAVDDKRVRDQGDLEAALSRLKPGDTMYLTVIRPEGNSHKTMKIAVHLGAVGEPLANAGPSGSMPPADSFTH
jgi:S1-C subfamily serine protease